MLMYLPQPAYSVAALAAFTGLRRSELAGQLWENYDGSQLRVTQSVWEGHVNEPKTRRSKAPVPVIPALARILNAYREQCGSPTSGPMFKSESKAGTPLNMNNVLNRMILPALNRCEVCRKEKEDHAGLITNTSATLRGQYGTGGMPSAADLQPICTALGVPDKTIQAILRHQRVDHDGNLRENGERGFDGSNDVTGRCFVR